MENPRQLGELPRAGGILSEQTTPPNSRISREIQAKPTLRDYQRDIVEQIETLEHPLVPLPTGAGKTIVAAAIIREAVRAGQRVLFVVHRRELVRQASCKLLDVGVEHAILMGDESSVYIGQPVLVASVQTLHARVFRSRKLELPTVDLIFYDEAHHCRARTYVEVYKAYPHAKIIGLTATPARGDGRGLGGDLFSDLVPVPTYRWLIERGYLVPSKVYAPVSPDLKGVKTLGTGDYSPGQLEKRMNTDQLVGGIVEHWHKLGEDRQTIVFTAGVQHSVHLRNEFRLAGVAVEHIDAKTPINERKKIIADFRSGTTRILCNCMIFTEGFDEPSASCVVLARPTKLLTMYRQMIGRVLRPFPGKVDARVLDHSGAVFRHGYPDDEIQWTLDPDEDAVNTSEAARSSEGGYKGLCECPRCSAVRVQGEACLHCGWEPATRPRYLEVQDGHLGEVQRDRTVHGLPVDERKFYRELKRIYEFKRLHNPAIKPGWIAHKFRDRIGRFPPWSWQDLGSVAPTAATMSWVRSRDIAYAKSMGGGRR
jgi:superfamily II DNA or RNA helicase